MLMYKYVCCSSALYCSKSYKEASTAPKPSKVTQIPTIPKQKTNKRKKSKGNQQAPERSRQVSPALRGPKPTKLKPPVIKETEATTEEAVNEPSQETTERG